MDRSGGIAAIVCDNTGNTVRQGYCYTCLGIGGYFGQVTKSQSAPKERRRRRAEKRFSKRVFFGEYGSLLP